MINILISINTAFFDAARIMLKSLYANNHEKIALYVFYSELDQKKIYELRRWMKKNCYELHLMKIDDSMLQGVPVAALSKETYFRLFAPQFLPKDVHKILYLDSDMIISGNISACYHLDMKDNLFMAVPDTSDGVDEMKQLLNMQTATYINAGVLLMNLDLLRKEFDLKKVLLFAKKNPDKVKTCDQDLINGFYHDRIGIMKWEYNYEARFHGFRDVIKYPLFYLKNTKNIKVIHYMGADKPWKTGFHGKYLILFYKYARNTRLQKIVAKNILIWPFAVLKHFVKGYLSRLYIIIDKKILGDC